MNNSNIIKAANVYIMKEIYSIVTSKKVVNSKFIITDGRKVGGKSSYKKWYDTLELNLGKNKPKRILDSALNSGKSGFTNDEIKMLASMTNIDSCYFEMENNRLIHITNMDIEKWSECFKDIKNKEKVVKGCLEYEVNSYLKGEMEDSEVVYRLIYYYIEGKAYCNEHKQEIIMEKVKNVAVIKPSEWTQCSNEIIEHAINDLESKLSFLKAYKYYNNEMNNENVNVNNKKIKIK